MISQHHSVSIWSGINRLNDFSHAWPLLP